MFCQSQHWKLLSPGICRLMLKSVLHGLAADSVGAVIDARIEEAAAQLTERQLEPCLSIDIVGQMGFISAVLLTLACDHKRYQFRDQW